METKRRRNIGNGFRLIGYSNHWQFGVFPFSPSDQQLLSMQSAIYIWLAATAVAIGVIKRYGPADSI